MTNEETLKWFKDDLKNGKCSDECCVFLVQTGGEKPLCPFRHCLQSELDKHEKRREETVK